MIIPKAERLNTVKEYYFLKKLEEIAKLNKEGKNVINFGIGSPDLAPSKETVDALVATARSEECHGYMPYRGLPELRKKISEWYRKTYNVTLDPDKEVLPLIGSKEAILHLTMAFVNAGDEVLVPDPGYPTYASVANLAQANIRKYDLKEENQWYPDFDELAKQDLSKVKIMWANYPQMPTGAPPDEGVLRELVAFAREQSILIGFDNPYSLVLNEKPPVSLLSVPGAKEVGVELNSLSKSHNMAGWRVGMMTGAEDYLKTALAVKSNVDSGMFRGLQEAAIRAFDNTPEWHESRNAVYRERREWVHKILDMLGFTWDKNQVGMFVWAKPKPGTSIDNVEEYIDQVLYRAFVFFTPGKIFGRNGEGYLRVSLCVPLEKIKEAYERLKNL